MCIRDRYKYDQPLAIRKIIRNTSKNERTRIHDDKSKIKMKNNFKAGQCMFNLIDTWNKTKKQYRMAGNLWSLKKMIKEETLNEIKPCTEKKCYMCNLDKHVNYESRMQQWWAGSVGRKVAWISVVTNKHDWARKLTCVTHSAHPASWHDARASLRSDASIARRKSLQQ